MKVDQAKQIVSKAIQRLSQARVRPATLAGTGMRTPQGICGVCEPADGEVGGKDDAALRA